MQIPFQHPQLPSTSSIAAYFRSAEEERWFSNGGPCYRELVTRLARRLPQGTHVVPVANCTLGLMLGLRAATLGQPGDEVLVPSFTFAATACAIRWAGLKPVFLDVRPDCWMLDSESVVTALRERGDRVVAVMAGSTFGAPPPADVAAGWECASREAGVPLIVDSAAGFGGVRSDGQPLGGLGRLEVFSLHATKPFAIGEGGLVCTRDRSLAERVASLANFGLTDERVEGPPGINAKLSEWACATALAVDDGFDGVLARRRASARRITEDLAATGEFVFQQLDGTPTWQFVPTLVRDRTLRDAIIQGAAARGVEIRAYFETPLHTMPGFADAVCSGTLHVTDELASRSLSLPMANDLTQSEERLIVDAIRAVVAQRDAA